MDSILFKSVLCSIAKQREACDMEEKSEAKIRLWRFLVCFLAIVEGQRIQAKSIIDSCWEVFVFLLPSFNLKMHILAILYFLPYFDIHPKNKLKRCR